MKLINSCLLILVMATCVKSCGAATDDATLTKINALDAAICKLDQPAVTAALNGLEQAHVQVRLLPFLKKLQNVDGAKRWWPKAAAWTGGVVAGCMSFLLLACFSPEIRNLLQNSVLNAQTAYNISDAAPLVAPFFSSAVVWATYRLWARRVRGQHVLNMANLLLASPALIAGVDAPLVEHVMTELTKQCGKTAKIQEQR